jgi:hypothetical protein
MLTEVTYKELVVFSACVEYVGLLIDWLAWRALKLLLLSQVYMWTGLSTEVLDLRGQSWSILDSIY